MAEVLLNRLDLSRASGAAEFLLRNLAQSAMGGQAAHRDEQAGPSSSEDAEPAGDMGVCRQPKPPAALEPLSQQPPAWIRVEFRIGTSFREIQENIIRQVYEHVGTQLRTATALGITPDTVSRVLLRSERRVALRFRDPEDPDSPEG